MKYYFPIRISLYGEVHMKKIAVLLANGFEEVEAVTPIDYLRRAGVQVFVTGVGGKEIKSARDLVVKTDIDIDKLPDDLDGVVVPGGMPGSTNLAASPKVSQLIKRLFSQGKLVAAICAAPAVVLAPTGILAGKTYTCYPGAEKDVQGASFSEKRVVMDGTVITSRAPGTAAEFSLALVEYLAGKEAAQKIHASTLQK